MKISDTLKVGLSALALTMAATAAQAYHSGGGGGYTVTCESIRHRPSRCLVGPGLQDVRILDQLSRAPCVQGSSWGYDRDSIWVANGCRANFYVTTFGGGYGGGGGGWGGDHDHDHDGGWGSGPGGGGGGNWGGGGWRDSWDGGRGGWDGRGGHFSIQ